MRTRAAIGSILASTVVLVGAIELGQQALLAPTSSTATAGGSGAGSGAAEADPGGGSGSGSTGGSDSSGSGSTGGSDSTGGSGSTGGAGGSGSSSTGGGSTGGGTASAALKDGTYTGSEEQSRYGVMQVRATISGGRITAVDAIRINDDDRRSQLICQQADPLLEQEVLQAQSAQVDTISGATYTSEGYLQSLQSALDQAR